MTQSQGNVRGAGRSRGGATDTTMLIWKVIAANPEIDRAGIWERVENGIPEGYALRLYGNERRCRGKSIEELSSIDLQRARGYILSLVLANLRENGLVDWEGDGRDRRYTAVRAPRYVGNAETVDVDGSKLTDHMAVANGLRVIDKLLARQNVGDKDKAALTTLAEVLRAKSN